MGTQHYHNFDGADDVAPNGHHILCTRPEWPSGIECNIMLMVLIFMTKKDSTTMY